MPKLPPSPASKRAAPKIVTACNVVLDRPLRDHLEEIAALDDAGVEAYFTSGRGP